MESQEISSFVATCTPPYQLRERCELVKGQPEFFEAATYALRYTDPVRGRAWLTVGQDAEAASVAKRRKELELEGLALGIPIPPMRSIEPRSRPPHTGTL